MADLVSKVIELAIQIQQIPAPTFDESRRAAFVYEKFIAENLADVHIDPTGNVLARLPGKGISLPLVISAHLDTVFPLDTDLSARRDEKRIYGAGIGDNSLGIAAMFGILWGLRKQKIELDGDIWFVANTCEEGLGDLRGMRAIVDRFESNVRAYLVLEGMAFGHIYNRGTGVRRYKVSAYCTGGHSWSDFGKPSAIHEIAALITRITALNVPSSPRTTFNIGRIAGGTSINTLAPEAWFELDLRSEGAQELADLTRRVEEIIDTANKPGVRFERQKIGERPVGEIADSHPLIRLAENTLKKRGVSPTLTIGSTDANIPLSRGYPAVVLGVSTGKGAHTATEYVDIPPIETGLAQLLDFVTQVWDK